MFCCPEDNLYLGFLTSFMGWPGREHKECFRPSGRIKNQFDTAEPKHKDVLPQNLPSVLKGPVQVQHQQRFPRGRASRNCGFAVSLQNHSKHVIADDPTLRREFQFERCVGLITG